MAGAREPSTTAAVAAPAAPVVPDGLAPAALDDLDDDATVDRVAIAGETAVDLAVRGLTLRRSRLAGVRLPGATFDHVEMVDVEWEDCDLSGLTLGIAVLARVEFRRCRLSGLVAPDLAASDVR
ncbi:MAG TPA: hypothetical protein VFI47_29035, partial [Acidimicrobiales bacterium]|nr:hypothetical protein [Acidimicrobiales bacterium]